jgi:hypothetical protein
LQQPQLLAFSDEVTRHWQNLAYGHHLPRSRPSPNCAVIGAPCSTQEALDEPAVAVAAVGVPARRGRALRLEQSHSL